MNTKVRPSDEQQKIIDETGNLVITAKPGSGKTFTVVEKIKCIAETLLDYQGVIAISFTRKASHELEMRCKNRGIPKKCSFYGTIDKFYITQIIGPFAKHLTKSTTQIEVRDKLSEYPQYTGLEKIKIEMNSELEKLLIKSLEEGNVFLEICGETAKYVLDNAPDCIKYIKARYTDIFIDEYQDCGEIQHKIFMQLVDAGLNGVAVGDLDQAIYAFSKRYSKYLASLITTEGFKHLQITKNHRCHESIANYSLRLMGKQVEVGDDLRVICVKVDGYERELMQQIDSHLEDIKKQFNVKNNNEIAILCRSNASAQIMDKYLRVQHKLFHENEMDRYGSHWARFYSEILKCYFDEEVYSINFCQRYIDEESDSKNFSKLNYMVNNIFDLNIEKLKENVELFYEAAKVVYPEYENIEVNKLLQKILASSDMLSDYKPASQDEVCILTLHKSKGLEYKIVFHMDLYKWIFPRESQDVSQEDKIQSLNLHYVGVTRAIEACYLMQGTRRYRAAKKDVIGSEESTLLYINDVSGFRKNIVWE